MSTIPLNKDHEFLHIYNLVTGQPTTDMNEAQRNEAITALENKITGFRIANLTSGLDFDSVQRRNRKDSVNHSVLCSLHKDGQIRYSMESRVDTEEGMATPGRLMLKFQRFKGPSDRAVFNWDLPWDFPWDSTSGLETGVDIIIALYVANAYNFNMHSTHEGCRSWS
jgi:hypothetical protein